MEEETRYTKQDLETMRAWTLQRKIQVTQTRLIEWLGRYDWNVYVSFSGGKDSTVLADLAARVYQVFSCPKRQDPLRLVFVNTGLEYPEIQKFVRDFAEWLKAKYKIPVELEILHPSMTFPQVLSKYGYERMRESVETYSTAGPLGGYEYFAKSASALIADVKATSPKPGEVDVRVLLTGGELPGEEILKEVLNILNADTVRPLTDHVTVAAPQAVPYNINVTYYTQEGGALSADTIAADVAAAVKSFQKWQAEKMGRDVNPSQLIALLMQTGVKRVEVRSPVFTTVADNAVAQIGTVSVVNGGAERE